MYTVHSTRGSKAHGEYRYWHKLSSVSLCLTRWGANWLYRRHVKSGIYMEVKLTYDAPNNSDTQVLKHYDRIGEIKVLSAMRDLDAL